jgi:hypothetical protein
MKVSPKRRALFKCDLGEIPINAVITRATFHIHIHTGEGLSYDDYGSVLGVYECNTDWDWNTVSWSFPWQTPGGDFGKKIMIIRAKEDLRDKGWSKGNPDVVIDFTNYIKGLQAQRQSTNIMRENYQAENFKPLLKVIPNPFNPSTTLTFTVPITQKVAISIFNPKGELVSTLVDKVMEKGIYDIPWNGNRLTRGIYLARLRLGSKQFAKKVVYLR